MVKEFKSKAEFDAAIASGKVILVDFYADWCGPCKAISPEFERLSEAHTDKENVEFYKADIDSLGDLASALGIRSIPTFHVYHGGKKVDDFIGANKAALGTLIQKGVALV